MNTAAKIAVACLALAVPAYAQTALQELAQAAGADAAPLAQRVKDAKAVARGVLPAGPAVAPETLARIRAAFDAAREQGFPGVEWRRTPPLGVRYATVPLQLASCRGCASFTALVPVGALTPTAPVGDPNRASYFLVERAGERDRAFSTPIPLAPEARRDLFAGCGALNALTFAPWALPQAVGQTQACLNQAFGDPRARRFYSVDARAGRFAVRACPADAEVSCQALIEVEGVVLAVRGRVPAGDPILADLRYSLEKRRGKLLGYHAAVDDESERN